MTIAPQMLLEPLRFSPFGTDTPRKRMFRALTGHSKVAIKIVARKSDSVYFSTPLPPLHAVHISSKAMEVMAIQDRRIANLRVLGCCIPISFHCRPSGVVIGA